MRITAEQDEAAKKKKEEKIIPYSYLSEKDELNSISKPESYKDLYKFEEDDSKQRLLEDGINRAMVRIAQRGDMGTSLPKPDGSGEGKL